MEGNSRL